MTFRKISSRPLLVDIVSAIDYIYGTGKLSLIFLNFLFLTANVAH